MIRVGVTSARVMSLEKMRNREIIGVSQDRNREQVLLLAAICTIAVKIPPCFIYQEELGDLRDIQEENTGNNIIYFAVILIS